MPRPDPDIALRRLIASLAARSPEDIESVLNDLAPEHAARARSLLDDYGRLAAPPKTEPAAPSTGRRAAEAAASPGFEPDLEGLSPWLAASVAASLSMSDHAAEAGDGMTPRAREALANCARRILPRRVAPKVVPPAAPSWRRWLTAWSGERA
ncbi:hypothetical protein [Caulobacter sp. DWR1-3-2b1]|uniref:hypothetical protein n=1 Tax=Caulobacter sp. DWR1-3-2b1 TaxID=2804670 RepID=UPI003CF1C77E